MRSQQYVPTCETIVRAVRFYYGRVLNSCVNSGLFQQSSFLENLVSSHLLPRS
ncbi:hypothetical protein OESDEN_07371 [Oesophagostomum dentatum]|uniref:Uncharacterized protein n=1 Tax=Oesophagostomum dentatum TaxID=61180 RepID=A0A0B1TBL6_OESDE|nr:hypothetical protein OESDEN_07371 [Oesophagostomum dentatum]